MVDAIIRTKLEGSIGDPFDFRPKSIREPQLFRGDLSVAERRRGPHQAEENALSESRKVIKMHDDPRSLETHPGNGSIEQRRELIVCESIGKAGELDRQWGMDIGRLN